MTVEEADALEELRIAVQNLDLDCGDNSCVYAKKKGGMRTNGGCRCFQDFVGLKRRSIERIIKLAIRLAKETPPVAEK